MIARQSPRPVALFWRLTGWKGLLPLGTGALFLLIGMAEPVPPPPRTELRETSRSVDVDLHVLDVRAVADGLSDVPMRIVSYEWRDPETGAMRQDSEMLPPGAYDGVAVGDVLPFTFEYIREEEIVVQDEATDWALAPVLLGLGGLIWAILAAWIGWAGWLVASAWRAATDGEVREARVTGRSFAPTGRQGAVRLGWTDAVGSTGQSLPGDGDLLPANGAVIVVYTDPVTGRGWWEGDL